MSASCPKARRRLRGNPAVLIATLLDFRFGSLADIAPTSPEVRFEPHRALSRCHFIKKAFIALTKPFGIHFNQIMRMDACCRLTRRIGKDGIKEATRRLVI